METFEDIYENICRVCLLRADSDNMVSLIEVTSTDGLSAFGKAVKTFAQITIETKDYLPKKMCAKCLFLLKQSIYFKFTCESADIQLRNLIRIARENKNDFKERVVEFIMFQQIFPKETVKNYVKKKKSDKKPKAIPKSAVIEQPVKTETAEDTAFEVGNDFDLNLSDCNEKNASKGEPDLKSSDYNDEEDIKSDDQQDLLLKDMEDFVESSDIKYPFLNTNNNRVHVFKKKKKLRRIKFERREVDLKKMRSSKRVTCEVCQKVLANSRSYEIHMQKHQGIRFICEQCGKGFASIEVLHLHQVTKHGIGPYLQCQHCPFRTARNFDLVEHVRIHTGERPFTCDQCGLTFRRRYIWQKHLRLHSEKTVQCPMCPRKFFNRGQMLAHSNNVHDRVYMYACEQCGAMYTKTATVRRHMTDKHGIPREAQGKVLRINKGSGFRER